MQLSTSSFAELFTGSAKAKLLLEIEEFLANIFYYQLQTNPLQKAVVIIESLMGLRPLYEAIGHVLFHRFQSKDVYFVLGNATPLYVSGMDSGLVVDCGY